MSGDRAGRKSEEEEIEEAGSPRGKVRGIKRWNVGFRRQR